MNTRQLFEADGLQTEFTFAFPYLDIRHVKVYLDGLLQIRALHYSISGNKVTLDTAPTQGSAVEIRRESSPNHILVDFTDGSVLREKDLDTAYLHNFYLSQEYADHFNKLINDTLIGLADGTEITATEPDEVITALVNRMIEDAAADTLRQRINDIDLNAEAIITLGESLQIQVNTLAQGVAAVVYVQDEAPVPGVGGVPDPIPDGARWYDSDENNKPYIYDSDSAQWVSIEDPRIGQAVADINVLQTDVAGNAAAIVQEALARSTADTALASTLGLLGVQNADQTAFIIDSATVKLDSEAGDTLANRFSQLSAADGALQSQITSEQTARADADGALASTISLIGAENGAGTAFILDTSKVKVSGTETFAERLSALTAADGDNFTAIQTLQTVDIPKLEAKYGVSLNVNGYVTGFVQNNDGKSGNFAILADRFAVVDPSGDPNEAEYVPFEIINGKINMRGTVQVDGDLLVNGSLSGVKLVQGAISADKISANAINAEKIAAGSILARHLAIDSNAGLTRTVFNPESNTPLLITDSVTGDAVFEIKLEGGKPKATVNGTAGENFVSNSYAIAEEVKKAINPYYSGAAASGSASAGNISSGGSKSFSVSTNIAGRIALSFKLSASYHRSGSTLVSYTAPDWTVQVRRNSASGTVIFSKRYVGTAYSSVDGEDSSNREFFSGYSISIDDGFVDDNAPANGSEVYYLKLTRHAGSASSLYCSYFKGEAPGFVENTLSKSSNGYWRDKDTGMIIQWSWKAWTAKDTSYSASWPVAFPSACTGIWVTGSSNTTTTRYAQGTYKTPASSRTSYTVRWGNTGANVGVCILGVGY
ncbi:phage tail fiber domain-containing protein [Microbulbifer sp. 2201CG32-9]|uniref:phage tail fiber domain-containing protein n=1 Tax=Microbulbifer sp. 2201CG32-9 TaxID=3232309 RepID=UPI00345B62C4